VLTIFLASECAVEEEGGILDTATDQEIIMKVVEDEITMMMNDDNNTWVIQPPKAERSDLPQIFDTNSLHVQMLAALVLLPLLSYTKPGISYPH